jgi:hypothetical protein
VLRVVGLECPLRERDDAGGDRGARKRNGERHERDHERRAWKSEPVHLLSLLSFD